MKFLIAGLGNIGAEYELTRHNIGFLALDHLADKHQAHFQVGRLASIADFKFKGKHLHLIKPSTYMNLSGKAVHYWLQSLKIPLENLLVITDDLSLPFTKIRLRAKGSHGGHNGLKNIEEVLQTQAYARLRMGIGSDFAKGSQVNYVLSNFGQEEFDNMLPLLEKTGEAVLSFCLEGIERAMNRFN